MNKNFDWNTYTFRCSSLGHIMSNPKGKSNLDKYNEALSSLRTKTDLLIETDVTNPGYLPLYHLVNKLKETVAYLKPIKDIPHLSQSCKTHLSDIYTSVVYGRSNDIQNKYIEKGLALEEDAITLYSLVHKNFFRKNKERKNNGFIEGEIDFQDDEYVVDTKVSWNIFTYNRVIASKFKPLYKWQLKGYSILWGKPKAKLAYCLLNTPENLIAREEKYLMNSWIGSSEDLVEALKELRNNHIYDDIPEEERVRTFEASISEDDEGTINNRVIECRKYLQNFVKYKSLEEFYTNEE